MFDPGVPALFFNPFYFARRTLASHIRDLGPHLTGRTLDVGCGSKPYRSFCHSSLYVGLEIYSKEGKEEKPADVLYDGHDFPFRDGQFDSVLTSQVLEHVFSPDEFLGEIRRVLKVGGILLLTVPFVWNEHEQPADFARYSSFGVRFLLQKHGFHILEYRKSVNDLRLQFQLLNVYVNNLLRTVHPWCNVVLRFLLISPLNLLGELMCRIFPKSEDLYLDNLVLAKKITG